MELYRSLGLMSGTSLDGLDMAYCILVFDDTWSFSIEKARTLEYAAYWKKQLLEMPQKSGKELGLFHVEYGRWLGQQVNAFLKELNTPIDLIASHGHTVFHQPENGFTFQLGDGQQIATQSNTKVVSDFRSKDVALGGQGAPLVPIGDQLLFSDYAACLNLGGFSNISYQKENARIAFDISPVNMLLNTLVRQIGKDFDKGGEIASQGSVDKELLQKLNALDYYNLNQPKSLGREWFEREIKPIIETSSVSIESKLRTATEHISIQIGKSLQSIVGDKVLVTGGGAKNSFLIDRITSNSDKEIVIPDPILIDYKEALVFSLLGVLKIRNEINCLSSVTGAQADSSSGVVFYP